MAGMAVAVIGDGFAGLHAARVLLPASIAFCLVQARDWPAAFTSTTIQVDGNQPLMPSARNTAVSSLAGWVPGLAGKPMMSP